MLAVGVLAAAAALVLGLRFSLVTLVLLTLATVINFATSVLERLKAAGLVIVRSFSIRKIRLSDAWP